MYDDELEVIDDNQDGVVDQPEDSDTQDYDVEDTQEPEFEVEDVEDDKDENEEVIDPKESNKQSPKENAQYKKMRLKAESDAKTKFDAERAELEAMKREIQEQRQEQEIRSSILTSDKIYEYANQEGISEELAEKMLKYEADNQINANKIKIAENFNKVQEQKKTLSKSKYFKLLEGDVDKVLLQHPDAEFKDVYKHMLGDRIDELEETLSKNVEKRTIANVHDRARRKNVGGSDGSSSDSPGELSEFSKRLAGGLGINPANVAKRVKTKRKNG